jgi:predicted outer membrane repeat protein
MRALWQRLTSPANKTSRRRPKTFRPAVQILEDRLTPATFLVTNPSDNLLPGSLRYALTQANLPGNQGSTIEITPQVVGPITLSKGELSVVSNMTIRNDSGAALEIHQTTAGARVFHIGSGATAVTLTGVSSSSPLMIDGGSVSNGNGGGILVDGASTALTLNYVHVVGNSAADGAGIYSAGAVTLTASSVTGNLAGADGGGIYAAGDVTVAAGSSVSSNQAPHGKGGGIHVTSGTVTVSDGSHVDCNSAKNVGGIEVANVPHARDRAVSVVAGSTVNGNSSTATVNAATADFGGGGIAAETRGDVYVDASQVSNNHSVGMYSGGIVVGLGSVTVTDGSQVNNNTNNGPGGGIAANFLGTVTVSGGSQVDHNTGAAIGGGIVNFAGPKGAVDITDGGQVDGNVLTNAESLGQAIAVFLQYIRSREALVGLRDPELLVTLWQVERQAAAVAQVLARTAETSPPGLVVAGGGIGTLVASVSVTDGEVDGNLSGQRVSGGNARSLGFGGGVFTVFGPMAIVRSAVEGNQAPHGDGGGVFNLLGSLTLDETSVSDNSAAGDGGGIWNGGMLFSNSSTLADNTAGIAGGGLFNAGHGFAIVLNSDVRGNLATAGGGMANLASLAVIDSTVAENVATRSGGGIWNRGRLALIDVVFADNSPDDVAWH